MDLIIGHSSKGFANVGLKLCLTSKTSKNPGKRFWSYPLYENKKLKSGYFAWFDYEHGHYVVARSDNDRGLTVHPKLIKTTANLANEVRMVKLCVIDLLFCGYFVL